MSDLDVLAEDPLKVFWHLQDAAWTTAVVKLLAGEIKEHRDRLASDMEAFDVLSDRLTTIESQARPFQESGELAVGREGEVPLTHTSQYWQRRALDAERAVCDTGLSCVRLSERLERAEQSRSETLRLAAERDTLTRAERDAAIARADEAEGERAEACEKLTQDVREHYPPAFRMIVSERDRHKAERDAAREALRKILDSSYEDATVAIAQAALDGAS